MPYKIHVQNREPDPELWIGGKPFATHIIPETAPLFEVETVEEAESELRDLAARGIKDVYAVGYDWPPKKGCDHPRAPAKRGPYKPRQPEGRLI